MKFVFTLLSCLLVNLSVGAVSDSLGTERRKEGLFVVHEVEEQETIYSIAKRYGSSVASVIEHNNIADNRIEIGQVIYVLIKNDAEESPEISKAIDETKRDDLHVVVQGETLYSISKQYNVKVKELRKWNDLSSNDLSPGMTLKLSKRALLPQKDPDNELSDVVVSDTSSDTVNVDPFEGFSKYLVQTGETLSTIAIKIGVSIDSLKFWNQLSDDYLKIGQQLFFRGDENIDLSLTEPTQRTRTQIDERGFERIYEEGVASVIQSMETSRFLALHRSLPIGTNLEVRNLMNNQVVYVKVVGKLPDTGLNKDLLLRLSQPAYDQLGILDSRSRVEVSYSKQ